MATTPLPASNTSAQPVVPRAVPSAPPQAAPQAGLAQQVPAQHAAPQGGIPKKPVKKVHKFFLNPDWLFVIACFIAVLHVMLLVFVENEKNEFNALKEADADRIYILQKASSVTQKDVNELEQAFLNEKDVILFIQTLETSRPMFDEFTLVFTSDEPQGKDPHYLPFSITAVGGYTTLLSFIEKLLGSTYVIDATNITLNEDVKNPIKVELTLTGNLYIKNGK